MLTFKVKSMNSLIKDGYERLVFPDCVLWYLHKAQQLPRLYCVGRFPFVPDYHVCTFLWDDDAKFMSEYPLQTFKTLAEALAVLRVLDASIKEKS